MTEKMRVAMVVIVAALGYFVDVYDLILFSVVRVASLKDLGLEGDDLLNTGVMLLNTQMLGMLTGGVLWGIWGDKRGRVSVLFGSILLYSVANIANGMVETIEAYAVWRFLAGVGLAGELGAGITLVSEIMQQSKRGYGTTIVASFGVSGALLAAIIGHEFHWRVSFYVGGAMGLVLLLLRVSVHESGMFKSVTTREVSRGNLAMLFNSRKRLLRYLACIMSGLPIWYAIGIIMTFSPEIGKALGMSELPASGDAIFYSYCGLVLGDLGSGLLSQYLKSRRSALLIFILLSAISSVIILNAHGASLTYFYGLCTLLGFAVGYWAVFVTTASEQFGTNLRATVTTSVPNFVRGAVVPITLLFKYWIPSVGILTSALYVGIIVVALALLSLYILEESFHKELDFVEH